MDIRTCPEALLGSIECALCIPSAHEGGLRPGRLLRCKTPGLRSSPQGPFSQCATNLRGGFGRRRLVGLFMVEKGRASPHDLQSIVDIYGTY
jgi:hypothetical protein